MSRSSCVVLFLIASVACGRPPDRIELTPVANGEWMVAGHTARGTILRKTRDLQPRRERERAPAAPEFALLADELTALPTDTFSRPAGDAILQFVRVADGAFVATLTGQPILRPSPTDSQLYAFDYQDAIWVLKAPGELKQLTLDDDVAALRARQREGEVILYWSVDPVWSADGKFIAFLSNREAVRGGQRGQSMWVIGAYTGIQGPLYDSVGESVHTEAVFGEEFVFINSHRPGVFAVHPRTRAVRKLGDGYVAAGHPRGVSLLLNTNGQLTLLRGSQSQQLPQPPSGHAWSTQAAIAPSGELVAVYSTDQAGVYTLHLLGGGLSVPPINLPALPSQGPAWVDDESLIFSVQERGSLRTYRARLR